MQCSIRGSNEQYINCAWEKIVVHLHGKKSLQRYICVQVCGLWQFTSQALIDCSCFQRCLLIIIPPCTSDAATFITHGLHASRLSGCLLSHSIGLRVLQESGRNRSAEKSALLKMVPISTCSLTSNVAPY